MDFGKTISEITRMMSSISVSGDSTTSTEHIKEQLSKITALVANLDQNYDATPNWREKVTDLLDLAEHLSDNAALTLNQNQAKHSKIRSLFSLCNRTSPSLKLEEIEKQLQEVAAGANATKLSPKNVEKLTNSDATEQEIEIVGRKHEKEDIIKQILPEKKVEGDVPVVTIVGIEGMGKTKLAKFIWDDEKVKSDFVLRIWVDGIPADNCCEFVVKRITESATKKKPEDDVSVVMDQNLNLREAMSGSRFLLVLDDLRNENSEQWLRLQQMLREAASPIGGALLITTQSDIVAKLVAIESSSEIFLLPELSEADSWTLFQQIAGVCKITDAQKKMVEKCRGVPVAILTMARLLRSHEATAESESEMNELDKDAGDITTMEKEFMQELLSRYYNKLPSWHLKQCFAYSSFYSEKDPQALMRLWMAEGFLEPTKSSSSSSSSSSAREPEDLGREYIDELRRRSIFHCHETVHGILKICLMPDLMQDLSTFVSGDDSFCMKGNPKEEVKQRVRRVSLSSDLDASKGIKSLSTKNKKLRTLLLPASSYNNRVPHEVKLSWSACDAIFSEFKRLRVLKLQDLGMKMLPNSIGELKSLRYLDLSKNNMKKLPSSIGQLKHLQTLNLSNCHKLKYLPNEVKDLVSLKHLEMEACLHLKHMPSTLKNLTWLQTLSHFVASTNKNHNHKHTGGLLELVDLNNLRGELEILHLERLNLKESNPEQHAYLKEKQHLQCLTLRWNHDEEYKDEHNNKGHNDKNNPTYSPEDDQISLEHLTPHPNLQALSIVGYQGKGFPGWLLSLKNLVQFNLDNCHSCKSLPPLDQLPKLKILNLRRLDSLKFIIGQGGGNDGSNVVCEMDDPAATKPFFPSLKALAILDCPNLTSWWKARTHNNAKALSFPSISFLQIEYCPRLDCMPLYPSLDEFLLLECSSMKPLQETLNYRTSTSGTSSYPDSSPPLSKLKNMHIENVEEQSPLPDEWLKNFTSLQYLAIVKCKGLKSLMKGFKHLSSLDMLYIRNCSEIDLPSDEWKGLKNLRHLWIAEIPKLKSLPEGIKHLTSLRNLTIKHCTELTTLIEGVGKLKSLTELWISECHKLASLPQAMENLTSLETLTIRNCALLLPRCQKKTGKDWKQIHHIKNISLKDTS